jgi:hypothetical protein
LAGLLSLRVRSGLTRGLLPLLLSYLVLSLFRFILLLKHEHNGACQEQNDDESRDNPDWYTAAPLLDRP